MDNNNSRMIYAVTKDGSAPTGDGAGVLTEIGRASCRERVSKSV